MSVSKLRKTVKDREAWCAARRGLKKSQTRLTPSTWQIKFPSLSGLPKFVFLQVSSNRLEYSFAHLYFTY